MRFQVVMLILFIAMAVYAPLQKAEAATDTSVVVARMDMIIKQMEALKLEFAQLVASIDKPSGSVLGAQTSAVFTHSLEFGETNSDIEKIQELLATDPEIYPYGVTSGFYGEHTVQAIRNFQTRFGLDSVGVIGPATKALLEQFFRAYPDGNYPDNALDKKPKVQGASTSTTPPPAVASSNPLLLIEVTPEYGEAEVDIDFTNGDDRTVIVEDGSERYVIEQIADRIGQSEAHIKQVIEFRDGRKEDEHDDDEDFDIDIEIDDGEVTVEFEFDGDSYEAQADGTDEDEVLEEVADELNEDEDDVDEDLWDAIEDALDDALDEAEEESEEIESITAEVEDGAAQIEVEYGDGDDKEFTVEEDREDNIIEEVADELDIDEDEVEDVIEFEYADVDEINVDIEDGQSIARVEFEDGTTKRIEIDSDDEDNIIEEVADELDEDEDDVEDWVRFDYLD